MAILTVTIIIADKRQFESRFVKMMQDRDFRTLLQSFWLLYLAGYVTLFSVMFVVLPVSEPPVRLATAVLLLAYGVVFASSLLVFDAKPLYSHLYLFAQTALLIAAIQLNPDLTSIIGILFLPIASQAPLLLSLLPGFAWVVAFIVASSISTAGSGSKSLVDAGLTASGFIGFGAFGAMLRQSEARRKEGQRLLGELREAHARLKQVTQQAEQLAVAEERNRLAREMHDALGHRLTVAVVQLEGARRLIPVDPDRAAGIVDSMRTQLKEALAELRQTLSSLREQPTRSQKIVPLQSAVSQLAHTFQSATGLTIHLDMSRGLPKLPPEHQSALFRAAQESLTNVQRHAAASQAWLALRVENGHVILTTRDDGQGFSGEVGDGRFGLRGLHERAEQLGGTVQLRAVEPRGAELRFELPLPGDA